jgi:gamma-glutamylcysteine synthetase
MSILPTAADTPIENKEQLIRYHADGSKPKNGLLIGTEHEKFVLDAKPTPLFHMKAQTVSRHY